MNAKGREFVKKLKALLKEYNAMIDFTCDPCSDTYGIYDAGMRICIDNKEICRNSDWYMDCNNVEK